jgi:uncharacterized membrane protein (UPF0127 family)
MDGKCKFVYSEDGSCRRLRSVLTSFGTSEGFGRNEETSSRSAVALEDTSMKSQNRLQQQKKLLQGKGIIFKHKVGNNKKAQHEIEIPWVDVAWIQQNEPLWGIQHENSFKTTELKKYRKVDSDISFY